MEVRRLAFHREGFVLASSHTHYIYRFSGRAGSPGPLCSGIADIAVVVPDGENSETDSRLDFAKDCNYISADDHTVLTHRCSEIGRMLNGMMQKAETFLIGGQHAS